MIKESQNTSNCNKYCFDVLQTIPAKKSAALDVEPVYTFRAHTGMNKNILKEKGLFTLKMDYNHSSLVR